MVPFALGGMGAFALAGVALLIAGAPERWLWICLAGFLAGIPGLITMLRHDANRRRRRALSHPRFEVHSEGPVPKIRSGRNPRPARRTRPSRVHG